MSVPSSSRSDRTVRVLGWAIAVLVLAILTAFVYIAASGILQPHSPRTAVENATQTLERDLETSPGDPKIWADYIGVLTYAERFTEASQAVDDAYASVSASMTAPIELVELELLFARGDYDEVLERSDGVLASINEAAEIESGLLEDKDVDASGVAGTAIGVTERVSVYVLRAKIYREREQWDLVIAEATKALEQDPLAADVLTLRGIAYAESGDTDAARVDFEKALTLGHEAARTELEKLER